MSLTFLLPLVLSFTASIVLAEIPGTALSNDRDVARFDLRGGLASPAPGISGGGSILWTMKPRDAVGVSLGYARHVLESEDAQMTVLTQDIVWEHSVALLEGFHALRARGGIGAARVHKFLDAGVASRKGKDADRQKWAPHVVGSLAVDFPVADLMWARVGIWSEKAFLMETPAQGGVFLGWVFGGQWVGIGD